MPRIDLAAAVPLPAPFAIYVEPTNLCNYKCGICPVSLPGYAGAAGYGQNMTWATWRKIEYDILQWGIRPKVMRFFNTGEPLLNDYVYRMIEQGNKLADRTELYTNGSLLNEERIGRLILAAPTYVRISIFGTSGVEYAQNSGTKRYYLEDITENVSQFRYARGAAKSPHIRAQLITNNSNRGLFEYQWSQIVDSIGIEPLHNWGGDTFVQLGGKPEEEKLVCPSPFYEMIIKANGDVTVCCVDWANKLVVGNVIGQSLKDIWNGEPLRQFQQMHLSGERKQNPICRDCNHLYTRPDNIDSLIPERILV